MTSPSPPPKKNRHEKLGTFDAMFSLWREKKDRRLSYLAKFNNVINYVYTIQLPWRPANNWVLLGRVVPAYNPITQRAEAGRLWASGQSGLHIARPCGAREWVWRACKLQTPLQARRLAHTSSVGSEASMLRPVSWISSVPFLIKQQSYVRYFLGSYELF